MTEYHTPGVYIEEPVTGPRPIQGVGTSVAAFVGVVRPKDSSKVEAGPIAIANWSAYLRYFEAPSDDDYLGHAVYGYFINGGPRCYVMPVQGGSSGGLLEIPLEGDGVALTVARKADLHSAVEVEVTRDPVVEGAAKTFSLTIRVDGQPHEFSKLTLTKAAMRVVRVPGLSFEVREDPQALPREGKYSPKDRWSAADFVGDAAGRKGIQGLEVVEDATMVACPSLWQDSVNKSLGQTGVESVQKALVEHCAKMKDRVAILDAPPKFSAAQVKKWRDDMGFQSAFATLYYPWVNVMSLGASGQKVAVPPSGHMAGVWARSDSERGVHKAPANEMVRGALEPSIDMTRGEQDALNPFGVNCIRRFRGRGTLVWGARTLSTIDTRWQYLNVRRLFNYVEKSVEAGTQWVVFEPNDANLWARVIRDIGAFLTTVWRTGALFGATADQAFYVKCDEELNPQEVRDQGKLIIEIGLAPVKPAEFVIIRFSQWAGGGA